jgi:hypothetical protein
MLTGDLVVWEPDYSELDAEELSGVSGRASALLDRTAVKVVRLHEQAITTVQSASPLLPSVSVVASAVIGRSGRERERSVLTRGAATDIGQYVCTGSADGFVRFFDQKVRVLPHSHSLISLVSHAPSRLSCASLPGLRTLARAL